MSDRLFGDDVIFQQRFLKSAQLYTGRLDGSWGPLTDGAHNAFFAQAEQIAVELGQFHRRTEGNLASLQLPAQRAPRGFMTLVLARGIHARVISDTRSYEEQNALLRRGRFGIPGWEPLALLRRRGREARGWARLRQAVWRQGRRRQAPRGSLCRQVVRPGGVGAQMGAGEAARLQRRRHGGEIGGTDGAG
jgi:hypothetical protein